MLRFETNLTQHAGLGVTMLSNSSNSSNSSPVLALVGDAAVGKSQLVTRMVCIVREAIYQPSLEYYQTRGCHYKTIQCEVASEEKDPAKKEKVRLDMVDVQGDAHFRQLDPAYLSNKDAYLIVLDAEAKDLEQSYTDNLNRIKACGGAKKPFYVFINKMDKLKDQPGVQDLVSQFKEKCLQQGIYCVSGSVTDTEDQGVESLTNTLLKVAADKSLLNARETEFNRLPENNQAADSTRKQSLIFGAVIVGTTIFLLTGGFGLLPFLVGTGMDVLLANLVTGFVGAVVSRLFVGLFSMLTSRQNTQEIEFSPIRHPSRHQAYSGNQSSNVMQRRELNQDKDQVSYGPLFPSPPRGLGGALDQKSKKNIIQYGSNKL